VQQAGEDVAHVERVTLKPPRVRHRLDALARVPPALDLVAMIAVVEIMSFRHISP
jgi:hypothetical protein